MLLCFSVLEFILGGAGLVFDFEGDHSKSPDSYSQIIYNTNLISETIQFLESNTCLGLEIIVDNEINYDVFTILQKKYNNGEKFDK